MAFEIQKQSGGAALRAQYGNAQPGEVPSLFGIHSILNTQEGQDLFLAAVTPEDSQLLRSYCHWLRLVLVHYGIAVCKDLCSAANGTVRLNTATLQAVSNSESPGTARTVQTSRDTGAAMPAACFQG
jgi:hypothetical protein